MDIKNIAIYLLIFLFFSLSVSAAKITQISEAGSGITIEYPKQEHYQLGDLIDFYFHVHNSTNYLLTNETTDCIIHIYGQRGQHLIQENLTFSSNGIDFEYEFNTTALQRGYYSYLVNCNNTLEAGFLSTNFQLTTTGNPEDNDLNILAIIIIYIFSIIFFVVTGYVTYRIHKIDTGKISFWICLLSFTLAIIEFCSLLFLIYLNYIGYNLSNILETNAYIISITAFGIGMITLILIVQRLIALDDSVEKWDNKKW